MIKRIVSFIAIITFGFQSFSQVKDYDETALLFGQEHLNGTARFTAMSGAFGALGGDLSSVEINPAGMAIFNNNAAAITLDVNARSNNNKFYNIGSTAKNSKLNFAQAGGLIMFANGNDKWSKFAISANVSISNNFDNLIDLKRNNGVSNEEFFLTPEAGADLYDNVTSQSVYNNIYGNNTKTTFAVATRFNKNTYFGLAVVNNTVDFKQDVIIKESSKDINDNTFNGRLNQSLNTYGQGIAFNFGVIAMPVKDLRLGLSFQTPTWYSLTEEFNENMTAHLSDASVTQPDNVDSLFEYRLRTPSKTTASIAYVFGKDGLLSLDYSYKDYSSTKLSPTNTFESDFNYNKAMKNNYNGVSTLNVGGEYRFKYLSLRAGYHYETSPYKNTLDREYFNGLSAGFGFKLSSFSKLDFAYNQVNTSDRNYYLFDSQQILTNTKDHKFSVTYAVNF